MTAECPFEATRDDRKSATLAAQRITVSPDSRVVSGFAFARDLLRSGVTRQAGAGAGAMGGPGGDPAFTSVFFLDGEPHKRKRQAVFQGGRDSSASSHSFSSTPDRIA